MTDEFGDRMKLYEMAEAGRQLMPLLPVIARLDGKCFSSFTRGLERPYDARLSELMISTTTHLVSATNAACGYTQSDEITLGWYEPDFRSQIFFNGRVQKMASVLAAMCSVFFNRQLPERIPEKADRAPVFDCRVWNVPNIEEGANAFLWREQDATKNSISMAAHSYYSHAELHGKSGAEKREMLWQKGVNWNDYPDFFKRGVYVRRQVTRRRFTANELESLPPKHAARTNPELEIERTDYLPLNLPGLRLGRVRNRAGVIFLGEEPVVDCE